MGEPLSTISAIILAGGMGTRLAALYPGIPKPMVPVADKPFLEWLVRRIALSGMTDIIISTGYKAEAVAEWAKSRTNVAGEKIRCVPEKEPLGTGGAIAHALPEAKHPHVMIFNGDTLLLAELADAAVVMKNQNADGAIFVRKVSDASRYGSIGIKDGKVSSFTEKTPGAGFINGGIYLFDKAWLQNALQPGPASFESEVFPRFLNAGAAIAAVATNAPFIDIGTPETAAAADAFIAANKDCF